MLAVRAGLFLKVSLFNQVFHDSSDSMLSNENILKFVENLLLYQPIKKQHQQFNPNEYILFGDNFIESQPIAIQV